VCCTAEVKADIPFEITRGPFSAGRLDFDGTVRKMTQELKSRTGRNWPTAAQANDSPEKLHKQKAALQRNHYGVCAIVGSKFGQDVLEMPFDCVF
jgi:hypothetical protein